MSSDSKRNWLPERMTTADGEERRVGVEIELAGVMRSGNQLRLLSLLTRLLLMEYVW